jgi:hypothetical protein
MIDIGNDRIAEWRAPSCTRYEVLPTDFVFTDQYSDRSCFVFVPAS